MIQLYSMSAESRDSRMGNVGGVVYVNPHTIAYVESLASWCLNNTRITFTGGATLAVHEDAAFVSSIILSRLHARPTPP